jgi:tetratricopeptide (TPR) repeat protein
MNRLYTRYFILLIVMLLAGLYGGSVHAAIHIDKEALNHSIATQTPSDYLEKIYQTQLDNGVKNFIPLSLLLINTSKQLLADGDPAKAAICAEYARRVSPDFPAAVMHEQSIRWQSNRLMLHRLFVGYVNGFQRKFYTLDDLAFFAFTQLAVFGAALMVTIAGIALLSLVRNSRLLLHDMRHVLPKVFPAHTAIALLVLLCLFPLLLGFSFAWLFPYWLMLFWVYHNVKERAFIGILVVVFVFLVPLIAIGCSFFLFIPQSDTVQRLWQANYGYYTTYDVDSFEQAVVLNPDDYELIFSAGLVNKREQNYSTALSYYNRLLAKKPRDFRLATNIGNVYFAMGKWDQAVEKYEAAIAVAPDRCAAAYFNLTRAYQQKFMFKEAERSLIDAKRLDSARVDIYLDMYSENYNRLLIDETIPRKDLWLKGLNEFLSLPQLLNGIWDLVFAGLRLPFGTLAILALLLLNIVFGDRDSLRVAAKCTLCGTIMCLRCQRNIDADSLCLKCQDFLKKQDQLSYKQKDVKKAQIYEYVRSLRRWISLFSICLPGMAHVLKGWVIQGAVLSFVFFWLFFQAIFVFSFKGPWSDLGYDRIGVVGVCTCLVAVLWLLLRAHVRTVRSAEIEDNVVLISLGLDS